MSWLVAVLGLAFLVLIHEAGHFFVARSVGMNPRQTIYNHLNQPRELVKADPVTKLFG